MLDPRDRQLLLESLRPPEGYHLDAAIGTTYSLDLLALLTAPLAFTFFDWEDGDGQPLAEPLALLEAVRRHAGRLSIYTQAGEIKLPSPQQRLVGFLEGCIVQVRSPQADGVFHPKLWVLRFVSEIGPVRYRVLCLSRNLTFDASWDTMVCLDGELTDRKKAIAANHPLADFIQQLPSLSRDEPDPVHRDRVALIARELRLVRFELPDSLFDVLFRPLGTPSVKKWEFIGSGRALLVMSPFVTDSFLAKLTEGRKECTLISRPDQLAKLSAEALARFQQVYSLDPSAEDPAESEDGNGDPRLAGLHAKVIIEDDGHHASLYLGSANATSAAYDRNVEFLVELRGMKSQVGIKAFLGDPDGKNPGFSRMLTPWVPSAEPPSDETLTRERLSGELDVVRRRLADLPWSVACAPGAPDSFDLTISAEAIDWPAHVDVRCGLASLPGSQRGRLERGAATKLRFTGLPNELISRFVGFELEAAEGDIVERCRFALAARLTGAPGDRLERLLAWHLRDPQLVLRLLCLLLQDAAPTAEDAMQLTQQDESSTATRCAYSGVALFELLVRSLARSPNRVRDAGKLIEDLQRSADGRAVLPSGVLPLWETFKQVLQGETHEPA